MLFRSIAKQYIESNGEIIYKYKHYGEYCRDKSYKQCKEESQQKNKNDS